MTKGIFNSASYFTIFLLFPLLESHSQTLPHAYQLSLREAESRALSQSPQLKATEFDWTAANEQAGAQFTSLLPKLSFQASYQYFGTIPEVRLGGALIPFGTNSIYSVGPVLNYTLWDTFSAKKAYDSSKKIAEARRQDQKNTLLQLLFSVRNAYIQVQLALEELKLTHDSLALSRAQDQDVTNRFKAGGAARLDLVTAHRGVLGYELQFEQKQATLSSAFQDLLALLDDHSVTDFSHPGPPQTEKVTLVLQLDSLESLLQNEKTIAWTSLDNSQPQIRSQELQAEAAELAASSQRSKLLPTLQLTAGITQQRLNMPNPPDFTQETVGVALTMPLYLGDPTWHLASQQKAQSEAAYQRRDQLRINLNRDFSKAHEVLKSLQIQKELSTQDILQSEEVARLYYTSYRAGKINLIDVQNANLQALQAKVNSARITAQILNQLAILKSLSGKELQND